MITRNQKQTIALIQIGTFLEYFDLYLYIHMAVLLNALFFPPTDLYTASLLTAFSFSSTFVLRPLGALFFGYIGDKYGRKSTIIVTTTLMAICSFLIASLPSYENIGIWASIILIACRMVQGFSSVGEITGARVYMTELTSPPQSYYFTSLVNVASDLGIFFALVIGSFFLFLNSEEGWRTAFYFGAAIAVIGSVARSKLRETEEFSQKKKHSKWNFRKFWTSIILSKSCRKGFLCYIGVELLKPMTFYLGYIYLGDFLRTTYNLTPAEVIYHNLFVGAISALFAYIYGRLSLKFYPLTIVKIRNIIFLCFALFLPFLMGQCTSPSHIFIIQCILVSLGYDATPAHAIFIHSFPIIGRYTQSALAFALSRLFMALITSYGCVVLGEYFGFQGITYLMIIFILIGLYSIFMFSRRTVPI